MVINCLEIPPTPLYQRGELDGITSKSSPFCKGGSRGILLGNFISKNQRM
jgi:hypothetical protein